MEFVIGWSIFGVLVSVLFFIVSEAARRSKARAAARSAREAEEQREEFSREVKYNRAHLPPKELPLISPDWDAVNRLIKETRYRFYDEGDVFLCYEYDRGSWRIPKSDFDGDTLKLIDLIKKDVDWFYGHPTGCSTGECGTVLEGYLREKYPLLSARSVNFICGRYCINDR